MYRTSFFSLTNRIPNDVLNWVLFACCNNQFNFIRMKNGKILIRIILEEKSSRKGDCSPFLSS